MSGDLPDFYFRVRENGAAVFRVDTENRSRLVFHLLTQMRELFAKG